MNISKLPVELFSSWCFRNTNRRPGTQPFYSRLCCLGETFKGQEHQLASYLQVNRSILWQPVPHPGVGPHLLDAGRHEHKVVLGQPGDGAVVLVASELVLHPRVNDTAWSNVFFLISFASFLSQVSSTFQNDSRFVSNNLRALN